MEELKQFELPRTGGRVSEDLRKARRFQSALRFALHDKEVEDRTQAPITFVFDADVVIGTIQGLTFSLEGTAPDALDAKLVVRALLSTNRVGKIHMLRPHLLEFDRKIHAWPDSHHTAMKEGFHRAQMEQLIEMWGLGEDEKMLADPTVLPTLLRENGYEFFIKVELCFGGTWQQRLHRLRREGIFAFDPLGPSDRLEVKDPKVGEIAGLLAQRHTRSHHINNVVDAAALVVLQRLLEEQPERSFRFYTDTLPMRDLFFGTHGPTLSDRAGVTILRDEDYFLMRASFPQLTQADGGEPADSHHDGYRHLVALSSQLAEILDSRLPDKEVTTAIRRLVFHGVPLPKLVDDFFKLKFVRSVVLETWTTPEGLIDFLPNVSRAFKDDAVLLDARQRVVDSFHVVSSNLTKQVDSLRAWRADCELIAPAIESRRKQIGTPTSPPQLDTDVGLARWGITRVLGEHVADRTRRFIQDALDDQLPSSVTLAAQLAMDISELRRDLKEGEYPIITLWFLQLYERLCEIWESGVTPHHDRWSRLRALYLVARVKSSFDRSLKSLDYRFVDEFDRCISEAAKDVERADTQTKPFALMAKAHVGYWAWKRVSDALQPLPSNGESVPPRNVETRSLEHKSQIWARDSYIAAARAAGELRAGSIEWAFAVNHCTYLAYRADIFRDERVAFYEALNSQLFVHKHYRFADTLATPYTMKARAIIRQYGMAKLCSEAALRPQREECRQHILRARAYLDAATPWFGDEEVNVHYRQLDVWLSELPA